MFPLSERKYPVYFHYPWSEDDTIAIELPAGFTLDNPEAPASLKVGEVGKYEVKVGATNDGRMLQYKRTLFFGCGGNLLFTTDNYAQLKQAFDILHQRDNQAITLRQGVIASN